MQILAILTVKNEGAFLLEWLAHHRAAGVTDVLAFSNDCRDGTDAMLDRLSEMGWLTHLRNDGPYDDRGIQFTALQMAAKQSILKEADWIVSLDIDEFVNVHVEGHTLPALIGALPQADAITLTWRLFGNAGVVQYQDKPVLETFTRAAPRVIHWPWRAAMFKTLYRNDGTYRKPGVHRPRAPDAGRVAQARWFDCVGRELGDDFRTRRIFSDYGQNNHKMAQLNHYPLGAMESYLLKADRGRAVHGDHDLGMDYWCERNYADEEDLTIAALAPARAAHLQALMADAELARLHRGAVEWRHETFRALMREEPNRALFARLLMTPPARPIGPRAARHLTGFALSGPPGKM